MPINFGIEKLIIKERKMKRFYIFIPNFNPIKHWIYKGSFDNYKNALAYLQDHKWIIELVLLDRPNSNLSLPINTTGGIS